MNYLLRTVLVAFATMWLVSVSHALTLDEVCAQDSTGWSASQLEIPDDMDTNWFDASGDDIVIPSWIKNDDGVVYFAASTDPSRLDHDDYPETRSYEYQCPDMHQDGYLKKWTGNLTGTPGSFSSYFALQALTWDYTLNVPVTWTRMTSTVHPAGAVLSSMPRYYARIPEGQSRFSWYHDFTTYTGYKTVVGSLQKRYTVQFWKLSQSYENGEKLEMTLQYRVGKKWRFIDIVIDPVNKTIKKKR